MISNKVYLVNSIRETLSRLLDTLKLEGVGPIIRRFFINTLFDSTFMLLGIIVGSALAAEAGLRVIMVTMLTTSIALGISTGVSVYEAESLEQEKKIEDLEKALFTDLTDTSIQKTAKNTILLATIINFGTPLLSCTITIIPFILVGAGLLEISIAGWISVALALGTLFVAGVYMGRIGQTNPYKKGARMVVFGVLAFTVGYLLDWLI